MKKIRYLLVLAAAVLLSGFGGMAHADRYSLSFSAPGAFIHYDSGRSHYGRGYYSQRHYSRHYRGYPRYHHVPRYRHYRHWSRNYDRHYGHGYHRPWGHGYHRPWGHGHHKHGYRHRRH